MATLTSHTLDSVNGTHAGGIKVELFRIDDGQRVRLMSTRMDEGGRLEEVFELPVQHRDSCYELVFDTGEYFAGHATGDLGDRVVTQAVVRFYMRDPEARYHIPLMLAPNSYSIWWSD